MAINQPLTPRSPEPGLGRQILLMYWEGFSRMTLGRTLWKIILLKLFVMFAVLKLFFFPDFLATSYDTDQARAGHVLEELTRKTPDPGAGLQLQPAEPR